MSNDKIDVTLDVDIFFKNLMNDSGFKDRLYAKRLEGLDTWSAEKKKEVMQELIWEASALPSLKSTFKM